MDTRLATLEDRFEATKLLMDFYKDVNPPFKTSAAWAMNLFIRCVEDEDKIAIIKDGGILLAAYGPALLGPYVQAYEIIWWVDPEKRGNSISMINLYEAWAKDKKVSLIELKSLTKYQKTGIMYKKLGYDQIETSWTKRLD